MKQLKRKCLEDVFFRTRGDPQLHLKTRRGSKQHVVALFSIHQKEEKKKRLLTTPNLIPDSKN
jgi:hypothetical protein